MTVRDNQVERLRAQLEAFTDAIAERDSLISQHRGKIRELKAERAVMDQRVLEIMRWMEERVLTVSQYRALLGGLEKALASATTRAQEKL